MRAARFPLVDAMRALAALSILAYHVAFLGGGLTTTGAGPWLAGLNVGVPLFFAISGFLLYRPWVAARLAGARPPALRIYALRRVLRIGPAYWVALVAIVVLLGREGVFDWPGAPIFLGFAQAYFPERFAGGIGQAWTLTVEVAFYAALPLIALAARRLPGPVLRGEALLLGGLVALSFAWRLVVVSSLDPTQPAYYTLLIALPAQLDVFAGGMALAVISAANRTGGRYALGWVVAAAAYVVFASWRPDGNAGRVLVEHELQAVIALGLLAPAVLGSGGPVRRMLAWRPLAWVGLVSYGVYLWHLDVLRELHGSGLPLALVAAFGLALSLALGAASWYGVERYAQRLGRRAAHAEPGEPRPARPLPTTAETAGR
jgi:peptidoglycan/LPS O-acetylase OafA/YrhL